MVDVVKDVYGYDFPELSAFDEIFGTHDGGFVDIIVYGSDPDASPVCRFLDFLDLGYRDCGGFFHEGVLAGFDGLHGIGMMGFHVGEDIDDVDCLDQFFRAVENLGPRKARLFPPLWNASGSKCRSVEH